MNESDFAKNGVEQCFATPSECYDTLMHRYGEQHSATGGDPNHLFRGEARFYPTSTPGTFRALQASSDLGLKSARIDSTGIFVEAYEDAGGTSEVAECLAQHYLSTSDGLDFSASIGIALAFALDEREAKSERYSYIAVLDLKRARSSMRFNIIDLRGQTGASRPDRQQGFMAVHRAGNFIDLKDRLCCKELGLRWYSFKVSPDDVLTNRHPSAPFFDELYDVRDDLWAAEMITHLEHLVQNPSQLWGEDGLTHIRDVLAGLRARTGRK